MAEIWIDGHWHAVEEGANLLETCLTLGKDLPYFCWHPALGSVGACRQCAVKQFKDENDTQGRLVIACMTPATEGTRISIDDQEASDFRKSVIEWLMANHPHDCPVCDEGGECHLQDMTVMAGHNYRRYRFRKRTYRNQDLGPFLNHEMNRCIQCYRCVRFYREYAGGRDLDVFAAHDHVYFGRHQDGSLESVFSGNLVEICPTGVFTDKTLKAHYTRKWDLQTAPSVCHHCGLGCNTIPGERYGSIRRVRARYNKEVNGYFLCDRGRYGYEFLNHASRPVKPCFSQSNGPPLDVSPELMTAELRKWFSDPEKRIGIGSPRASLESNFQLREFVGASNFFSGISDHEHELMEVVMEGYMRSTAGIASLEDVRNADAVLVLGEDLTASAPMLDLAVRQAVLNGPRRETEALKIPDWHDAAIREAIQDRRGPLYVLNPACTGVDDIATAAWRFTPLETALFAAALSRHLDPQASFEEAVPEEWESRLEQVLNALTNAKRPLVVSGTQSGETNTIRAAVNCAMALRAKNPEARICLTVPECNSLGLMLLNPKPLSEAILRIEKKVADKVVILENDLHRRAPAEKVLSFFDQCEKLLVMDSVWSPTAAAADAVLPSASFGEGSGALVNNEGRLQAFYAVHRPKNMVQESWRWLAAMEAGRGRQAALAASLQEVRIAISRAFPIFQPLAEESFQKPQLRMQQQIPQQPFRYSGRTAMHAHEGVHEPRRNRNDNTPYVDSMEGCERRFPGSWAPRFWAPEWNSVQSINKLQVEVGGELHGGSAGRRLFNQAETTSGKQGYERLKKGGARFQVKERNEVLLVATPPLFGSEELSARSPAVAQRSPKPFVALHPEKAKELEMNEGETIAMSQGNQEGLFDLRLDPTLAPGCAGFPTGLPGAGFWTVPAVVTLRTVIA